MKKEVYGGINTKEMQRKIKNNNETDTRVVVVHCGTNNLKPDKYGNISNKESVKIEMGKLLSEIKTQWKGVKVIVSGILFRQDVKPSEVNEINDFMCDRSRENNYNFLDGNSWLGYNSLKRDGLHLNKTGAFKLGGLLGRVIKKVSELPKN